MRINYMRGIKYTLTILLALLMLTGVISPQPTYAVDDAILAVVNDELITLKDLRDYVRGTYVALVAEGRDPEDINKVMLDLEINGLNKLIEDKLLLSKANEIGMNVKEKLIDQKLEEVKGRYNSEQDFMKALVSNGVTVTDLRKKIVEQLKIAFVIDHEVKSKIYVNPQEVTDYYEANMERFQDKEKIFVESIYIPYESNRKDAIKRANVALELIKNGEPFTEVAKEYSKASSLGEVERGQLLPKIEKIVFHLERDKPSDVIEVESGAYIFLVTKKFPAQLASLSDVKDFITEFLFRQKLQNELLSWLENLKKDAYIEIKQ